MSFSTFLPLVVESCDHSDLEESASNPLPLPEGALQVLPKGARFAPFGFRFASVVRSILIQVSGGRQSCPGGSFTLLNLIPFNLNNQGLIFIKRIIPDIDPHHFWRALRLYHAYLVRSVLLCVHHSACEAPVILRTNLLFHMFWRMSGFKPRLSILVIINQHYISKRKFLPV